MVVKKRFARLVADVCEKFAVSCSNIKVWQTVLTDVENSTIEMTRRACFACQLTFR